MPGRGSRAGRMLASGCAGLAVLFSAILLTPSVLPARSLPLEEKLGMLGYDQEAIEVIASGRKSREELDREFRLGMLGFTEAEVELLMTSAISDLGSLMSGYKGVEGRRWKMPGMDSGEVQGLIMKAQRYFPIVREVAREMSVKESLILAMMKVESDFNPYAVSRKGAMGLMQLMPDTARELGVRKPFDPGQNIRGGACYIARCLSDFGEIRHALAAYNAGPERVERTRGIPRIEETRSYVKKVLAYEHLFSRIIASLN